VAAATVAAVGIVDAVRREEAPPPAEAAAETIEGQGAVVAALSALGVRGVLELSDDGCRRGLLTLPSLELRRQDAACGPKAESPDGRLLIPRAQLERAARRHPKVPDRIRPLRALVDDIAWLTPREAAVAISIRLGGRFEGLGPLSTIAFFRDGRLRSTEGYFRITGRRLDASPRGSYVTQAPDVILRADGSQVSLPLYLRDARHFAWSADERWLAVAGAYALTVVEVASLERYDATGGGLRSVTLPQTAARVDWR
jgi:hypothetical protein